MKKRNDPERVLKLFVRACEITDRRANGLYTPIFHHMALIGSSDGMLSLAFYLKRPGRTSDRFSSAWLYYRAYRMGSATAAQNLAMDAFNSGDMKGYRVWLRRASRLGDDEAAVELLRFEIRLPHGDALHIRKKRPERQSELRKVLT